MARLALLLAAMLLQTAAHGQSWPAKPVRFVVPFPPGGSTDFAARTAKVLALPEVRDRLAQAALQPVGSTPAELAALMRADIDRWRKLARELGIEPQ